MLYHDLAKPIRDLLDSRWTRDNVSLSFLVLAFAASNHCNQSVSARHQIVFSVCLGLAFLTRFDSCLITIPLWWNQTDWRFKTIASGTIALAWLVSAYGVYRHFPDLGITNLLWDLPTNECTLHDPIWPSHRTNPAAGRSLIITGMNIPT